MDPVFFTAAAHGDVVRTHSVYWAYVARSLPPPLEPSWAILAQAAEAHRRVGELAGITLTLPNPHLLIRPFVRREAVLSSRIEGTVTRLDQIFLFEAQPDELHHASDVEEVINHVHALEVGLERLRAGRPL